MMKENKIHTDLKKKKAVQEARLFQINKELSDLENEKNRLVDVKLSIQVQLDDLKEVFDKLGIS